ncbi:hypothetical protein [Chryseobacterium wangxinyae]|uniref:hypothetical protein n=1 Tax=Chryseobacterium sp. CY353 TaxID=2997334 RepID=UPI00227196B5|nr:hypothetical protein [Chryseobacterium sp. CY353]MCY0967607.1 hypothetical protein [Chryseobacterium sp. CY353]
MKKIIIFLSVMCISLLTSIFAQNITLLGSTTVSATGSGLSGIPANFSWNIPAGQNRAMVVHFFFERDHRPGSIGENYPTSGASPTFFDFKAGAISMTQQTVVRTFYRNSVIGSENDVDLSTSLYRYTLTDTQGLPTGATTFDFSNIKAPLAAGDEVAVSIEVYGNVSPTTSFLPNGNAYWGSESFTNNFSLTPTAATVPVGKTAADIMYVAAGATSNDENLTLNAGWTNINPTIVITNNNGNALPSSGTSTTDQKPDNEADGLSLLTAWRLGTPGNTTLTKSNSINLAGVRLNTFSLLPLAKPSITGNVYHDTDGPADINGIAVSGGGLFVNLINSNGLVVYSATVTAGAFTIPSGYVTEGETFSLSLSKNAGTIGQPAPATQLNTGWTTVGESTTLTGNDGSPNGQLILTAGTSDFTGLKYGILKDKAPGGVISGLGLWTKADKDFSPSLWKDQSGNDYDLTQPTLGMQPVLANSFKKFNYNPAVNFPSKAMGNNQVANRGVNNSLSMYSVASLEVISSANTLHGVGASGDNPHLGAYPGAKFMMWTSLYGTAANPDITLSQSYLMSGHWQHAVAGTARIEFDGFPARTGGNQSSPAGNFIVGNDFINAVSQPWIGLIPEVIVYTSPKSGNENQRINSYLGIKYGLTLRNEGINTGTFNYLSSNSTAVWNGTANPIYHNNVFGIGRDDISTLHQKVSVSVNSGTIVTMATNNDFVTGNLDPSRTAISDDQEFFVAGDNNNTSLPMMATTINGNALKIIQRKWLSQRTGTTGNTYFQADLSTYENQFSTGAVAYMIIADNENLTTNVKLVLGTKVGSNWVFNNDFDPENVNRYFTFGVTTTSTASTCYKPGATGTGLDSKVGITSLSRAGAENTDNWPMARKGAWLALEAKTKGFVPNRVAFDVSGNPVGIASANFVEGMMVFDTTNKCLKMYTVKDGSTLPAWHCMSTQTCPDATARKINIGYWAGLWDGNEYALGGTGLPTFNSQLQSPLNYGTAGTYNKIEGINFFKFEAQELSNLSGAQLKSMVDVFCVGVQFNVDLDAATIAKIKDFTDLGGVVIVLLDNGRNTPALQGFGGTGTVGSGSATSYTVVGTTGSTGVFGNVPGNTAINAAQTMGRVLKTQLAPGSEVLANEGAIVSANAGIWTTGTNGRVIFFWDEGVFRNGAVSGTTIDTAQEKYLHNIMAYALDKLGL